jgi:hypothetical protein
MLPFPCTQNTHHPTIVPDTQAYVHSPPLIPPLPPSSIARHILDSCFIPLPGSGFQHFAHNVHNVPYSIPFLCPEKTIPSSSRSRACHPARPLAAADPVNPMSFPVTPLRLGGREKRHLCRRPPLRPLEISPLLPTIGWSPDPQAGCPSCTSFTPLLCHRRRPAPNYG